MIPLSERVLDLAEIPQSIGYVMCLMAAIGLVLWIRGRFRCHPLALCAVVTLAGCLSGANTSSR